MSPFIHLGHVEIKKLFTWTCTFNFPCLLESGLSSLVGNDFNEKILKSELIIVILITNKNFLNHDSPEINRVIMLHVTKKCCRPFSHWQKTNLRGRCRKFQVSQSIPENGWAFLTSLPQKKSFVSWNKWILELGTSNFHQALSGNYQQQHRRGRFIFSLDSQRGR